MTLKTIIKEQREELESIKQKERIIQRELLVGAKKILKHPNALAILGIRRCGKSIFSYLLVENKKFGYINFDDERLWGLEARKLNDILKAFYELYEDIEYIILDEIQNVKGWELFVNRLRRTKKVIITGSNSKMLMGDLAAHLTGRYIDVTLSPFSFREFLTFHNVNLPKVYTTKENAIVLKFINKYIQVGGFPEVDKFGAPILARIYEDIVTKDVLLRYKIKKIEEIKKLSKYLITNFGEEISYRKTAKILGIKRISTLSKWVSYLEDSFLLFKLERFSFKLKQQFIAPKKIYSIDNGLINATAFGFSKNIGRLMENTVAVELRRRKLSKKARADIYYWKDHQQNEVDFAVKTGPKIQKLIQVTYAVERTEIKEREIKSLLKAGKELKCRDLSIITYDFEKEENIEGKKIQFIPLWKWLLEIKN